MPDREYQLEERLEALVRFSAPGEEPGFPDYDPLKSPTFRGGRRRKHPRTGGVLVPRDSKASWAVNIRPKNWGNRDKIWLGKLKCMEEAQRIADIIFHYLGCEPAHARFPDPDQLPPPFLDAALRGLDSVEKRMRYVKRIAKGDQFQGLRRQLMDGVKEMVKFLSARPDVGDVVDVVDVDLATCVVDSSTWSVRSPPELAVERFDETYGKRGLSFSFPVFSEEEIESMMNMLLPE